MAEGAASVKVVIPARYGSSRLPGKPLADIAGTPMVIHVWRRAVQAAGGPSSVVIAVDDDRVADVAGAHGAQVLMTCGSHASGTERSAEVADRLGWDDTEIVVNLQGDEPLIPVGLIARVAGALASTDDAEIATLACPFENSADISDPNLVKVVCDVRGRACYFSRAPIPHDRTHGRPDLQHFPYLRHIGLYAYRVGTLRRLSGLPPAPMETIEHLEQLKALWHGMPILVERIAHAPPHGVDTPDDLAAVRRHVLGGPV